MIKITHHTSDFNDWDDLLRLIQTAFSYMETRIDPPSSMYKLTAENLKEKAEEEALFLVWDHSKLIGCTFVRELCDALYIGKVSVAPDYQGQGIGQKLVAACQILAAELGKPELELQSRVELIENHSFFRKLGFHKTGETAHEGYDRPTSITMRRPVAS